MLNVPGLNASLRTFDCLSFSIENPPPSPHARRMSHVARARNVFDIEAAALKKVRAQLDANFDRAVDIVVEALGKRGKIIVVGIGKSGNVGRKIAATLTSTGSTSRSE